MARAPGQLPKRAGGSRHLRQRLSMTRAGLGSVEQTWSTPMQKFFAAATASTLLAFANAPAHAGVFSPSAPAVSDGQASHLVKVKGRRGARIAAGIALGVLGVIAARNAYARDGYSRYDRYDRYDRFEHRHERRCRRWRRACRWDDNFRACRRYDNNC